MIKFVFLFYLKGIIEMLIAEINGNRTAATKGAKGICPFCKSEVVAKCGEQRIAHWAHKSVQECDTWHDAETEWHRMWKNRFPQEWQESIKYDDKTGEKHIADVCTENGFVLEFQHSAIKPEERRSREAFYKNMNWIVDGTRLKNDYKRFSNGFGNPSIVRLFQKIILPDKKHIGNTWEVSFADELFPKNWSDSTVPVVFDFKGSDETSDEKDLRRFIFCLLPEMNGTHRYVLQIPYQTFIENAQTGSWFIFQKRMIDCIQNVLKRRQSTRMARHFPLYYPPRRGRLPEL